MSNVCTWLTLLDEIANKNKPHQQITQLNSQSSKVNSLAMLHASIDGGFDEACINNEYYFDSTNDQSWACTFGTGEEVRALRFGILATKRICKSSHELASLL